MQTIGRFEIQGPALLIDGFTTYSGRDPRNGTIVEVLTSEPTAMSEATALRTAVSNMTGLDHAGIVRMIEGSDGTDGSVYLALEKRGKSLDDVIQENPGPQKIIAWMSQLAEGLDYLHAKGILHRNVTPRSVWIDDAGVARLGGFELSSRREEPQSDPTGCESFFHSSPYQPPEFLLGDDSRPASDQFSLAVLAIECLVGQGPFAAERPVANIFEIVFSPAQVDLLESRFPAAAQRVFERALSKAPARRFSSCAEFTKALDTAISGRGATETRAISSEQLAEELARMPTPQPGRSTDSSRSTFSSPAPAAKKSSSSLWVMVGIAVVLALGAAAYFGMRSVPDTAVAPPALDPFKDAAKSIVNDPGTKKEVKKAPPKSPRPAVPKPPVAADSKKAQEPAAAKPEPPPGQADPAQPAAAGGFKEPKTMRQK